MLRMAVRKVTSRERLPGYGRQQSFGQEQGGGWIRHVRGEIVRARKALKSPFLRYAAGSATSI